MRLRWGLGISHFPESPFHRLIHQQGGQHSSPKADGENDAVLRGLQNRPVCSGVVGGEDPALCFWVARV